jgi:hypothetical protein
MLPIGEHVSKLLAVLHGELDGLLKFESVVVTHRAHTTHSHFVSSSLLIM